MLKSDQLLQVAREAGYDNPDDLAAAVGFGHIATAQIVGKLVAPASGGIAPPPEPAGRAKLPAGKAEDKGVRVQGARDLLMQLSRCCNPVPGDRILGYITRGRGLTIHAVDCPNLEALDYDKERLVEVEWDTTMPGQHAVKVAVIAVDKTGVLANVSSAISECHANISRAEIMTREDRKAELDFVVEITDTSHLNRVLKAIERVDGVITARRVRAWQERS
jgi:GTP pyrophosphokinase